MRRLLRSAVVLALLGITSVASATPPATHGVSTRSPREVRAEHRQNVLSRRATRQLRRLGERTSTPLRTQFTSASIEHTQRERAQIDARLSGNRFNVRRRMRDYARTLGRRFENKLRNMGPHQHWIDMGAGEANAIGDYLSSVFPQNQAQVSALSVVRPDTAVRSDRFQYHEGRVLSEYTVTDLGQADLITDYYGPAFYAGTLDQTIEQYGHLLREGGEAWIVLAQPGQNAEISINGVKLDGSTRARKVVERWLAASSGFELVEANYQGAIGLRRTSAPVRMATLRPTRINAGAAFLAYDYAFSPDHVRPEAARHGNE